MEVFILFFLAETIIFYTISRLKLYFEVIYHRSANNDELTVKIKIFKSLVLYNMCIPAIAFKANPEALLPWLEAEIASGNQNSSIKTHSEREQRFLKKSSKIYTVNLKRFYLAIKSVRNWFDIYNEFMRKVIRSSRCEYLCWNTTCGTGDAATTALISGLLWSFKGRALERIKNYSAFQVPPVIHINPEWGKARFTTAFQCIFSIRIGHVITAVMKSFFTTKKV